MIESVLVAKMSNGNFGITKRGRAFLRFVVENGYVAIFAVGLNPCDSFEIHDVRAVNAEES